MASDKRKDGKINTSMVLLPWSSFSQRISVKPVSAEEYPAFHVLKFKNLKRYSVIERTAKANTFRIDKTFLSTYPKAFYESQKIKNRYIFISVSELVTLSYIVITKLLYFLMNMNIFYF